MKRRIRREHIAMILRGLFWQMLHLRCDCLVLKGRGAKIYMPKRAMIGGVIKIGNYATLDLRRTGRIRIETGFSLGDFSIFRASGSNAFQCPFIDVGQNVTFGPYCNVGGGFGLQIGANVIAGPYVSIHPEEHQIYAESPIRQQPIVGIGVKIDSDCWLGAKVTILDGANIARGAVIGAGTVLKKRSTEPYGIYVGSPGRILKHRLRTESDE